MLRFSRAILIMIYPIYLYSCGPYAVNRKPLSTPTPDPSIIEIRLRCVPQIADLYFDEWSINGKGEIFDADKGTHTIRCSLAGYETFEQKYDMHEDQNIVIRLTQESVLFHTPTSIPTMTPTVKPAPVQKAPKINNNERAHDTNFERFGRKLEQGIANGHDWQRLTAEEKKIVCVMFVGLETLNNLNWEFMLFCLELYYSDETNLKNKITDAFLYCGLANIGFNEEVQ